LLQLSSDQWREVVQLKVKMANARMAGILRLPGQPGAPHLIKVGDIPEQHHKVARAQYQAFRQYRPRAYPSLLTLFRARMQPLFSAHAPDNGWGHLATGGLDIRVIPGNHLGMLQEPHVRVLAEQLGTCLDGAQRQMRREE